MRPAAGVPHEGESVAPEGVELPPTWTRETLGIADISKVVGSFQTTFPVAEKARNDNLKLVASRIDGMVLQPGQELEFRYAWLQRDNAGRPVSPGTYQVRGVLPIPDAPLISETQRIEIVA